MNKISVLIWGVTMKFPKWFYCKHTCILTAHWQESPSKNSPWAAVHLAQWCCQCWKHFWKSCWGTASSAVVTFFFFLMSSISWNLHPFKTNFMFGNSQKLCFISSDNFWQEVIHVPELSRRLNSMKSSWFI